MSRLYCFLKGSKQTSTLNTRFSSTLSRPSTAERSWFTLLESLKVKAPSFKLFKSYLLWAYFGPPALYVGYYLYADLNKTELCAQTLQNTGPGQNRKVPFERQKDVAALQATLSSEPSRIVVLLGPPGSGSRQILDAAISDAPQVLRLSLRSSRICDVNTFVRYFSQSIGASFLTARTWALDWLPLQGTSNWLWKNQVGLIDFQRCLACLTSSLRQISSSLPHDAQRPVIVISDSEVLSDLLHKKDGKQLVDAFLEWCTHITKETSLAHVVFVPGCQLPMSYLFPESRGMETRLHHVYIGHLDDQQARRYLSHIVPADQPLTEQETIQVLQTFGGNMDDLDRFAVSYKAGRSVEGVIKDTKSSQGLFLLNNLLAAKEVGTQTWAALKMVAESPNGFLPYRHVQRSAFNGSVENCTKALLKGFLGFRFAWTPDLGGDSTLGFLITTDSPLTLAALKDLLADQDARALMEKAKDVEAAADESQATPQLGQLGMEDPTITRLNEVGSDVTLVESAWKYMSRRELDNWEQCILERQRKLLQADSAVGAA